MMNYTSSLPSLKQLTGESQNWRCCTCGAAIEISEFSDDQTRLCRVEIDRSQGGSYENSVALCVFCAGDQANFESLLAFYEWKLAGSPRKTRIKTEDPEIIPLINVRLTDLCRAADLPSFVPLKANLGYRFAQRSSIDSIVERLFRAEEERASRPPKIARQKFKTTRGYRRKQSEAQNHRCCYCGVEFSPEVGHPRYSTWEHVLELRKGGADHPDNMVLACFICNNLRDRLDLDADAFYSWAQANLRQIEGMTRTTLRRFMKRKKKLFAMAGDQRFPTLYSLDD